MKATMAVTPITTKVPVEAKVFQNSGDIILAGSRFGLNDQQPVRVIDLQSSGLERSDSEITINLQGVELFQLSKSPVVRPLDKEHWPNRTSADLHFRRQQRSGAHEFPGFIRYFQLGAMVLPTGKAISQLPEPGGSQQAHSKG